MNLDKLKEAARRHELREEWRKAIEVYHRALAELADAGEPADPSLFNRIGDLELKAGGGSGALHAYEQAADTYADQGFFNNAIALCGKILRVDPSRTATYLRLAELHARKNVGAEVRRNLAEYVERMESPAQVDHLVSALRKFAERFALSLEQRNLFGDVLRDAPRAPHTREALERLAGELGLDDGGLGHPDAAALTGNAPSSGGLVFIDTSIYPSPPRVVDTVSIQEPRAPGEEATATPLALESTVRPEVAPLAFIQPTAIATASGSALPAGFVLEGFEPTRADPVGLVAEPPERLALEAIAPEPVDIPGLEPLPTFFAPADDFALEPIPFEPAALPLLDVPGFGGDTLFDELDVEEEAVAAAANARDDLAGTSDGDLEGRVAQATAEERWDLALRALAELLRRHPDAVAEHQKRVEVSYRSGDRVQLIGAYLSLAQALERAGARENAVLIYERVREHDPGNPVAEAALTNLAAPAAIPAEPVPVAAGQFVDLGALIMDPEPEKDTRMRVDQGEPVSEEDVDFRETLEQFKQGVAANIDAEDFQAHYDLGIAFKEMGLLDEAIAQFQQALRAPEGRLKSSEALGTAFFEKRRFAIAEAVLARAIESLPGADDEKIGLIYWLGRTLEGQGKAGESLRWYERALAVDITFLDLSDRIQRLTTEIVP